jgi:hypothetical protein
VCILPVYSTFADWVMMGSFSRKIRYIAILRIC